MNSDVDTVLCQEHWNKGINRLLNKLTFMDDDYYPPCYIVYMKIKPITKREMLSNDTTLRTTVLFGYNMFANFLMVGYPLAQLLIIPITRNLSVMGMIRIQ